MKRIFSCFSKLKIICRPFLLKIVNGGMEVLPFVLGVFGVSLPKSISSKGFAEGEEMLGGLSIFNRSKRLFWVLDAFVVLPLLGRGSSRILNRSAWDVKKKKKKWILIGQTIAFLPQVHFGLLNGRDNYLHYGRRNHLDHQLILHEVDWAVDWWQEWAYVRQYLALKKKSNQIFHFLTFMKFYLIGLCFVKSDVYSTARVCNSKCILHA